MNSQIVHQGQTVTFETSFRTSGGVATALYKTAGGAEGVNVSILRGGEEILSTDTTSGSDGSYSFSLTFYHWQWEDGTYTVVYSGFDANDAAQSFTFELSVLKGYVFADTGGSYFIADIIPFIEDAVDNGPHHVSGETAFGSANFVNTRFVVMGKNIVQGSETVIKLSGSGAQTPLTRGATVAGYTINYDDGIIELTSPPEPGDSIVVNYSHKTYSRDRLMQAAMRACTTLSTKGILEVSITNQQPTIDTDPATIMGMLILSAQISVLEMQVQADARKSFDFSDSGLSLKRSTIPKNQRELLNDFKQQLDRSINVAAMDVVAAQPATDRYREYPQTQISTVFELDS